MTTIHVLIFPPDCFSKLSYSSFPCCMPISQKYSLFYVQYHLLYKSHHVIMCQQCRIGFVVVNVHKQVMLESCCLLTASHAHSHPYLVSLLFVSWLG